MLKNLFFVFMLVVLAVACKNNPTPNNANSADSTKVDTTVKKDTIAPRLWIIKDSSLYAKTFLQDLYNNPDSISLVENYVIYKHDTVYFPDYFDGNRQTFFETLKDSADYKLQIFNCTYTKIQFIFSATKNNKRIQNYYGEAELQPNFFSSRDTTANDADSVKVRVYRYKGENDKYDYEIYFGTIGDKLLSRFFARAKDSITNKNFTVCPALQSTIKYVPKHKRN